MKNRYPVTEEDIESAFEDVKTWLKLRLKQKGDLSYASPHEMWGIIDEELDEFKVSVYAGVPSYAEALQVAAVAVRIMEWLRFEEPSRVEAEMCAFLAIQRKRNCSA